MQYAYYAFFDCSFWWFSLLFFIEGSIRFLSIVLTISSHTQRKPSRSETKVDGWHRTQNEFLLLMRHFIQQSGASKPLDVTVYGAVKAMYKKAHGGWMKTNAGSVMQIMHIPKLVREACSNNVAPNKPIRQAQLQPAASNLSFLKTQYLPRKIWYNFFSDWTLHRCWRRMGKATLQLFPTTVYVCECEVRLVSRITIWMVEMHAVEFIENLSHSFTHSAYLIVWWWWWLKKMQKFIES